MEKTKIMPTQKKTYVKSALFLRRFSVIVAHYLNMMGVYPNQVVLFRVFVFGGAAMALFFQESYVLNLCGLGMIFLCYFFDLVDGDLARNYNKKTDQWKFLDEELDSVVVMSLVLTFALKFSFGGYETIYVLAWYLALYGIIGSSKMTNFFKWRFDVNCVGGHDKIESASKLKERDRWSEFFYQLTTPKNFLLSLFSNFRYFLLVGVLTNHMEIAVLLFAIAINIRWILLFIAVGWFYTHRDWPERKVKLFAVMKEIERVE